MSDEPSRPAGLQCVCSAMRTLSRHYAGSIPHHPAATVGLDYAGCTRAVSAEGCAMVRRGTVTDKEIYQRQRELQDQGWKFDTQQFHAVSPHHGDETPRHYLAKAAIANHIANRQGGRFVTEAEHPDRGQADIIDLRPGEPAAVVIEVETDCTRERHLEKCEQYAGPCIRDVFIVDPTEAPTDVDDWPAWLDGELP